MIHQAKFIDPGFGSLIYLRCENSQCESRQVKVDKEARFRPQFGAAIANLTDPDTNSFLVLQEPCGSTKVSVPLLQANHWLGGYTSCLT